MITHEDIVELKKVFDDRYDERYVKIADCNDIQQKINSKFANDDKRIDLLIHNQKINNWLTLAIASGIVSLVIKIYLGG